jgi:hypothetical protein
MLRTQHLASLETAPLKAILDGEEWICRLAWQKKTPISKIVKAGWFVKVKKISLTPLTTLIRKHIHQYCWAPIAQQYLMCNRVSDLLCFVANCENFRLFFENIRRFYNN